VDVCSLDDRWVAKRHGNSLRVFGKLIEVLVKASVEIGLRLKGSDCDLSVLITNGEQIFATAIVSEQPLDKAS
jgi:hypothetical protein